MNVCLSLATPAQLNVMVAQVEGGGFNHRDQIWVWSQTEPTKHSQKCPDYLNDPEFVLNVIKGQGMSVGRFNSGGWHVSTGLRAAVGATLEEAVLRCYVRHSKCENTDNVDIPEELA